MGIPCDNLCYEPGRIGRERKYILLRQYSFLINTEFHKAISWLKLNVNYFYKSINNYYISVFQYLIWIYVEFNRTLLCLNKKYLKYVNLFFTFSLHLNVFLRTFDP